MLPIDRVAPIADASASEDHIHGGLVTGVVAGELLEDVRNDGRRVAAQHELVVDVSRISGLSRDDIAPETQSVVVLRHRDKASAPPPADITGPRIGERLGGV